MRARLQAGAVFFGFGLGGFLAVIAYAVAGGNPLETSIGRRTPASLTLASSFSTGLGLALLLNVEPIVSLLVESE